MALLPLVTGTVSYLHMDLPVELHGQPGWVAALTPLSVDEIIVAASTTPLADSTGAWRRTARGPGCRQRREPGRQRRGSPALGGIPAWPSFAVIGAYELLMCQVRHSVA